MDSVTEQPEVPDSGGSEEKPTTLSAATRSSGKPTALRRLRVPSAKPERPGAPAPTSTIAEMCNTAPTGWTLAQVHEYILQRIEERATNSAAQKLGLDNLDPRGNIGDNNENDNGGCAKFS